MSHRCRPRHILPVSFFATALITLAGVTGCEEDMDAGASAPSGGSKSVLGQARDSAESTIEQAEQQSQDLADRFDQLDD